ncbi:DNA adenine methylase [Brevundimonas sp.]|uniref:DNA adenine methylase n=1 Tax=Brevundimonas sp. TaxID=1871086 RepID=UPI00289D2269|nr:DNA adenine methylase [Brevundimonas sp.]
MTDNKRDVLYVDQRPVAPAEPPAAWLGGKSRLAKRICGILAATPHTAYVEPFIGMGGVFLRRAMRPKVEVINDINGDIVTLFRVIQRFPEALLGELRWKPSMRSEFNRLKESRDCDLLDIERAARFIYLQRLAFGGKVSSQSFGVSADSAQSFSLRRLKPRLDRLRDRLDEVVIENLDWLEIITRYDAPGTLFYLDPPYWGGEGDYGSGLFVRGDFQRMADKLKSIKGSFLLSINDRPEIREMFAWADIEEVAVSYSIAKNNGHVAPELLIGRGVKLEMAEPQAKLI